MTTEQFTKGFHTHMLEMLDKHLSDNSNSHAHTLFNELNLNSNQKETLKQTLKSSYTDIYYSLLLGLDGCAPIGDLVQQQFTIFDENNNQICGNQVLGELETSAYDYFHNQ